jgi:hypothetical protein
MDVKTAELRQTFSYRELRNQCKAVWGGVSWPGKSPGCAVVVGMGHKRHLDSYDIYLLDEYESFDTRQLVRQCGALDYKYSPEQWIGDYKNDAASRFIQEMNDEYEQANLYGPTVHRWRFNLNSTQMLDMENLYPYIMGQIRELVHKDRKQLFLKDGKVASYMLSIEESEIATLELGDYPAIEALAFAVLEMRRYVENQERIALLPKNKSYYNSYKRHICTRGFKNFG